MTRVKGWVGGPSVARASCWRPSQVSSWARLCARRSWALRPWRWASRWSRQRDRSSPKRSATGTACSGGILLTSRRRDFLHVRGGGGFAAQAQGMVGGKVPGFAVGAPAVAAPEGQAAEARMDGAGKVFLVGQFALALGALAGRGVGFGLRGPLRQQAQGFFGRSGQLLLRCAPDFVRGAAGWFPGAPPGRVRQAWSSASVSWPLGESRGRCGRRRRAAAPLAMISSVRR